MKLTRVDREQSGGLDLGVFSLCFGVYLVGFRLTYLALKAVEKKVIMSPKEQELSKEMYRDTFCTRTYP